MSHVASFNPAGPTDVKPGETITIEVTADTPDLEYQVTATGTDGSKVVGVFRVDGPAVELVLSDAPLPDQPHKVNLKANGGTLTILPGAKPRFSWTAPPAAATSTTTSTSSQPPTPEPVTTSPPPPPPAPAPVPAPAATT